MAANKIFNPLELIEKRGNLPVIETEHLTKDYGGGRGIFDVSFNILKGETVGYVGTNGSGKTTTIRHIMGFLKAQSGGARVLGMDSWADMCEIKRYIGYIPGEIAYPGVRTGTEFLKIQADFYRMADFSKMNSLIKRLQLDPSANLRRMSKGMKQKTAIVSAFMSDAPVLILDEPSTGLDPLMREVFVDIVREEKQKGKTIFMSSQLFDEVESVCDRVVLIRDGKIIASETMDNIRRHNIHTFEIAFSEKSDYEAFLAREFTVKEKDGGKLTATVNVSDGELNFLFAALKDMKIKYLTEVKYDFECYFNAAFRSADEVKK